MEEENKNNWNTFLDLQKEICKNNNSIWNAIDPEYMIGVSLHMDEDPIHGLRHPAEKGTTGWFIWTGEYCEEDNFLNLFVQNIY